MDDSLPLSLRSQGYPASPIRKLIPYAKAAEAAGHKVFYLNIGEPNHETPSSFFQPIHTYQTPHLPYAPSQGHPELLTAIQGYFQRLGYPLEKHHFQVTQGATDALLFSLFTIANPGDDILTFEPFYPNYLAFTAQLSLRLVGIPTTMENAYALPSLSDMEMYLTPKTKAILISNPSNPTGRIYTDEELTRIVAFSKKHQLWIISDELYHTLTFAGKKATTLLAYQKDYPAIVVIDSVSKRYAACGARIGCLINTHKPFMERIFQLGQSRLGVPLLDQLGAAALYRLENPSLAHLPALYEARRDKVIDFLSAYPWIHYVKPEATFYLMLSLPIHDSNHFCTWLIEHIHLDGERVLITPAENLYVTPGKGKNEVRLALVLEEEPLLRAMNILVYGLQQYMTLFESLNPSRPVHE